jgi:hypothetical protein
LAIDIKSAKERTAKSRCVYDSSNMDGPTVVVLGFISASRDGS